MRFLIDTNALIWATVRPDQLSTRTARLLADPANIVLVSAASAWEIATKVRLGKLPLAFHLERDLLAYVSRAGYIWLAIDEHIGLRAARLTGEHRDPFDRIIAAHALAEDIPVISPDPMLDIFGVRRLW